MKREFRKWFLNKVGKDGSKELYEYHLRPVQRVKFIKKAIEILKNYGG